MIQINFRIDDDLKSEADYVLGNIGLTMSSALNMFIRQLVADRGIPFEVRMPDNSLSNPARIRQAMLDYENGKKNYHYHELPDEGSRDQGEPKNQSESSLHAKTMV